MSEFKGLVGREKYWDERTESEKIEALAVCVRRLADQNYELIQRLNLLEGHGHDSATGRLMVPLPMDNSPRGTGYHNWAYELRERRDP